MSTNKFGIENILGKNKYLDKSIMTANLQTTRWVKFKDFHLKQNTSLGCPLVFTAFVFIKLSDLTGRWIGRASQNT